jgi:hypothetical protein
MRSTQKQRQALVQSPAAQFPYTIEFRTADDDDFRLHSYIQTPSDERMFIDFANTQAEYRIRQDREQTVSPDRHASRRYRIAR